MNSFFRPPQVPRYAAGWTQRGEAKVPKNDNDPQLSVAALFRYLVVSQLRAHLLRGATKAEAIREVMARPHCDLDGRPRELSERSLYRWLEVYQSHGLAGLETASRPTVVDSAVLSDEFLRFLRSEKKRDPDASVPELIESARICRLLADDEPISRVTVWRACRRMGLPLRRIHTLRDQDMRRFSYPHRMLMVLADGKHFRAGRRRRRRVALSFLDDASRFGLNVLVGTRECTELFLHALHPAILHHGLMRALFLDGGPGFISADTAAVLARLEVHLIHGTAAYPEGHGKIERFQRTFKQRLLRGLDGDPTVDPDPQALTLRLQHWMREVYNHKPHEALGGQSPAERWAEDSRALEYPRDPEWLDACFLLTGERTVANDNVVSLDGKPYETPRGYAGQRIRLTRHLLSGEISMRHQGRQCILHPPDLEANAYSRREPPPGDEPQEPQEPPQTAADRRHQADFEPLVGPDGNFPKGEEHE